MPSRRTSTLSAADLPTGTLACGRLGSVISSIDALLLDLIDLDLELADLLRARFVRRENVRGVLALALRARHFVARRVLIALEPFELGDQSAPARLERRQLLELGVRLQAAIARGRRERLRCVRARYPGSSMP